MADTDWLEDMAVLHEMVSFLQNREGVFDGNVRKLCLRGTDNLRKALSMKKQKGKGVKICVSSNIIDWNVLESLPYTQMWKQYDYTINVWNPALGNPEIYLGKNIIWDIDNEESPMRAFEQGEQVCEYLVNQGYEPMMVFSGGKGFHIWLNEKDSTEMVGKTFSDIWGEKVEEPHKKLSKYYQEVVLDVFDEATGEGMRKADKSPVYGQGIIGCPYSLHGKTGQIVWPLSVRDLQVLRGLDRKSSIVDIAVALHTQENGQLWETDLDYTENPLYYPPCHTVGPKSGDMEHRRGLPAWKGIDG